MRFELSNATPPHLNRGLQLRMLGFVGMIAIILFVLNSLQPRKPDRPGNGVGRQSSSLATVDSESQRGEDLDKDAFLSPPDLKRADPGIADRKEDWQEPPPLDPMETEEEVERAIARREAQFDKSILAKVKDSTIGIRHEEADAYFRLLDHARHVPLVELEKAGLNDVQYINLMDQPQRFRGEPITIRGDLFRLRKFPASPNAQRVKSLYEAWIFTPDSSNHPYRVICTSIARDIEPGDDLRKPVQVTGYFFKREGYASNGGMHVAPTLLASRIEPYRVPGSPPPGDDFIPYMVGLISAIGLAFLVTLLSFAISDRRAARLALERKLSEPAPSFAGIVGGSGNPVKESLQMLADQEWEEVAREQSQHDAAASLHARDRVAEDTLKRESPVLTEAEREERQQTESQAVRNWTAQHHPENSTSHASHPYEIARERREAARVLDQLEASEPSEAVEEESSSGLSGDQSPVPPLTSEQPAHPTSPQDSPTAQVPESGNVGNGFSKLAAWEQEVRQLGSTDKEP